MPIIMRWNRDEWRSPADFSSPVRARMAEILDGVGDIHALERISRSGERTGTYIGATREGEPSGRGLYVDARGATISGTFAGRRLEGEVAIWLPDARWFRGSLKPGVGRSDALKLKPAQLASGIGRLGPAEAGLVTDGKVSPPKGEGPDELRDYDFGVMRAPQLTSDGLSYAKSDLDRAASIYERELEEWEASRQGERPPRGLFRNERNQVVDHALGPNAGLEDYLLSWPLPTDVIPTAFLDPVWGVPMLEPEHPTNAEGRLAGPARDRSLRLLERAMVGAPIDAAQPDERLQLLISGHVARFALSRDASATRETLEASLKDLQAWRVADLRESNLDWPTILEATIAHEATRLGAVIGNGFTFRGDARSRGALTLNVSSREGILQRRSFAGRFRGGRPEGPGRLAFEVRREAGAPWQTTFEAVGAIAGGQGSDGALALEGPSVLRWDSGVELLADFRAGRLASSEVRIQWKDGGWYEGPVARAWSDTVHVTFGEEVTLPQPPTANGELFSKGRGLWRAPGVELSGPGLVGQKTWRQPIASKEHQQVLQYHGGLSLAGEPHGEGRLEAFGAKHTQRLLWSYRGEFRDGLPCQTAGEAELSWGQGRRAATFRGTVQVRAQFEPSVLASVWIIDGGKGRLTRRRAAPEEGRLPPGEFITRRPSLVPDESVEQPGHSVASREHPPAPGERVETEPSASPSSAPPHRGPSSSSKVREASAPGASSSYQTLPGASSTEEQNDPPSLSQTLKNLGLRVSRLKPEDVGTWFELASELADGIARAAAYQEEPRSRPVELGHPNTFLLSIRRRDPSLFRAAVALHSVSGLSEILTHARSLRAEEHRSDSERQAAFETLLRLERQDLCAPSPTETFVDLGADAIRRRALQVLRERWDAPDLKEAFARARARIEDEVPELSAARALTEEALRLAVEPPTSPETAAADFTRRALEIERQLAEADAWVHPRLGLKLADLRVGFGNHQKSRDSRATIAFLRAVEAQLEARYQSPQHLAKMHIRDAKGINEGYWYEATHVDALLRALPKAAGQRVVNPAGSLEQLRRILAEQPPPASGAPSELWIAPYNPTQDHWRAVILQVEARDSRWTVTRGLSLDPKDDSDAPFPAELAKAIIETMRAPSPKWLRSQLTPQRDDVSCGPLVVEYVARVLESSGGGALKSPKSLETPDMRAVRARHAAVLKGLGFEDFDLVQRYNVPEVHHGSISRDESPPGGARPRSQ